MHTPESLTGARRARKPQVGIESSVRLSQLETASRNFADPAPLSRHGFKYLGDQVLRRRIAVAPHGARILIFEFRTTLLELGHRHANSFQQIERLKARHHDRYAIAGDQVFILLATHHRTYMTRREEGLYL
jgi:hypothetical protein